MSRNITITCATCYWIVSYLNRGEARRNGWTGIGWERSFARRCYWRECPLCAAARKEVET